MTATQKNNTIMAIKAATLVKLEHHEQQELCRTRAAYRQGRKLTAVKVYTVNDESQHIIISGVPQLQLADDIKRILLPYGSVKKIKSIPDYPSEEFTEAFHIHFERIQSARIAKRFVDGKNFFGGLLHVFYAPELESIAETRKKLAQRRKDIAVGIRRHKEDPTNLETDKFEPREQYHRKKKYPTLPLTEQRLARQYPTDSMTTICGDDGIPQTDSRPVSEPSLPANWHDTRLTTPFQAPDNRQERNYRNRRVDEATKVRVVRPRIVDTRKLENFRDRDEKAIFTAVKKVNNGMTIKILPKEQSKAKKRIVIKDPSVSRLVTPSDHLRASIIAVKSNIREAMKN